MESLLHQVAALPSPAHADRACLWRRGSSDDLIHLATPFRLKSTNRRAATQLQAHGRGFGVPVSDKRGRKPEESDSSSFRGADINGGQEEDDSFPQVVFNRMIRRILFSVGAPMASGIGLLYIEGFVKSNQLWEVPRWLPLLTILLSFGTSALGIAYGSLSTSWDPNKEGSLLGWEQAQKNWLELWKEEDDGNNSTSNGTRSSRLYFSLLLQR